MTKTYFTVAWIVSLVAAIIYSVTIIGLILGIPLFIAMSKFKAAQEMEDSQLVENRKNLLGWGIFLSIVLAPTFIGLIVILVFVLMVNNQIKNIEEGNKEKTEKSFGTTVKEGTKKAWEGLKETFSSKSDLQKEKDQLAELDKMKEEGIISEEEYNAKRKQILKID